MPFQTESACRRAKRLRRTHFQTEVLSTLRNHCKVAGQVRGMIVRGMTPKPPILIPWTHIPATWAGLVGLFAANQLKCLSTNHLHAMLSFPNQAQSRLI